ncbi:MAG: glycolate oxidase FAD binding subunit [Candidatus Azotimanducaceae bacterium]|jgi:glycolate oxidase FAD binding subunit
MELQTLCDAVSARYSLGEPFAIVGGDTHAHLGLKVQAEPFNVGQHQGIIEYHPAELVVRVRAGTPLDELAQTLSEQGQMLAFDPISLGSGLQGRQSTIGGAIATGSSGSRRPYSGAARDYVLGVSMVLHSGETLSFGGQVMKNVAGYDVSRLVCGSFGMLGVISDVSLKVLPKPVLETNIALTLASEQAMTLVRDLRARKSSVSACCYLEGRLYLRLSGSEAAVQYDLDKIGGDVVDDAFFTTLDRRELEPFQSANEIWRLSTDPGELLESSSCSVFDWGFAQRWLFDPPGNPRDEYAGSGHWTCIRSAGEPAISHPFQPLDDADFALHRRVKTVFDPDGLFNPGRLYPGL